MVAFYLRSLLSCVVPIIGVVFSTSSLKFLFEMCLLWFILILVVNDVLESLKLESKPPSPEHMVGRQSA